jgi:hypothetical protein
MTTHRSGAGLRPSTVAKWIIYVLVCWFVGIVMFLATVEVVRGAFK